MPTFSDSPKYLNLLSISYIFRFFFGCLLEHWVGGGRYKNGPFVLGKILEGKKKGADLPQCFRVVVVVVASCIGWWRWWVGKNILDLLRISLKCLRFRLFTIFVLLCFFYSVFIPFLSMYTKYNNGTKVLFAWFPLGKYTRRNVCPQLNLC